MGKLRAALLLTCIAAAPLAIAGVARAAELHNSGQAQQGMIQQGMILYNADGQPVAMLTPLHPGALRLAAPAPFFPWGDIFGSGPAAPMIAQQNAMISRVMDEMQALDRFATDGFGPADAMPNGNVTQVMISSFGSGHGACSETVTYRYDNGSAKPVVAVHKVGDACGAITVPALHPIPAAQTRPHEAAPTLPSDTRLVRVDYRP